MTNIIWLADIRGNDLPLVGGKAANLGELLGAGFRVPDGFVITTDAYRAGMSDELAQQIMVNYGYLVEGRDPRVAVRSSATAEDLADASFAGQQDSYLQVESAGLLQAVQDCWDSLHGERAVAYREHLGVDESGLALAVVVQRMVQGVCAGVMFTANPSNGHLDQTVITAAWGLGDAVVSGTVNPDELVLGKGKVVSRKLGARATVIEAGGPTSLTTDVVKTLRSSMVLDDDEALALAALGERIESHFKCPQDIEWARDADDEFHILQARPITAMAERVTEVEDRWPARAGNMYFRSSIVEQLPEPLTPLFAQLAAPAVIEAMEQSMTGLGGKFAAIDLSGLDMEFETVNGWAYYRFSHSALLKLARCGLPATGSILANGGRVPVDRWRDQALPEYRGKVAEYRARDLATLGTAELLDAVQALLDAGCRYYAAIQTLLPTCGLADLAWQACCRTLVGAKPAPAEQYILGYDSAPVIAEKRLWDLSQWVLQDEALTRALAGSGAPGTTGIGVAPERWAEWCTRFQAYLDEFGHTVYNLDFVNPVPADDPTAILQGLRFNITGQGTDPYARQERLAARREQAGTELFARLDPIRAIGVRKTLAWAQELIPIRETALADLGLAWPVMRHYLAELGRRLVAADLLLDPGDIYWLQRAEILSAESRRSELRSLVDDRKALWRGQSRLTPPQYLPQSRLLKAWDRFLPARPDTGSQPRLNGSGCNGVVTGIARVVNGPEDFAEFVPGEILVAPITTPAFTPLFAVASAVVTDVGGVLSHGSIVAREYGIPAVLGTGAATTRIKTGDEITVDGVRGVVMLDEPDEIVPVPRPWLRYLLAGTLAAGALAGAVRALQRVFRINV
jgi:pyruvate,water dikinase